MELMHFTGFTNLSAHHGTTELNIVLEFKEQCPADTELRSEVRVESMHSNNRLNPLPMVARTGLPSRPFAVANGRLRKPAG